MVNQLFRTLTKVSLTDTKKKSWNTNDVSAFLFVSFRRIKKPRSP